MSGKGHAATVDPVEPKIKPIRPQDVRGKQSSRVPEGVIEAINELIVKNAHDGRTQIRAVVKQGEAEKLICKRMKVKAEEIYSNHWLDIEPLFREAGWKVTYNKAIGWDNFDSHYIFESEK